jgi:CheY-like chemotaxis protein
MSTVLIIEDDEDIAEVIRMVLEKEGYDVELAENGRAGLEALAPGRPLPAAILLDLMMPTMNGFAFREAQLADPRIAAVPVVMMTADSHVMEKTERIRPLAALAKPFDVEDLVGIVHRATAASTRKPPA